MAGISFGRQVSMATATLRPGGIRRFHLTGVGTERDSLVNVHLANWKVVLGSYDSSTIISDHKNGMDRVESNKGLCDPTNNTVRCTS